MTIQEITIALNAGKPIGQLSLVQKEDALRTAIESVYRMKSMRRDKETINSDAALLEKKLTTSYPHLTIAEVDLALTNGVAGEFKDVSSVPNVANMISWIAFYNRSADRDEALRIAKQKQAFADAMTARLVRDREADGRNAKALAEEPAKAYAIYLAEGRDGFCLPQYISEVVYPGLLKMGRMTKPTASTIEYAKQQANHYLHKEQPRLTDFEGANKVTFETYQKREMVFAYFEALRKDGRTTL